MTIIQRGQGYEIYRSDSASSHAPYSPSKGTGGENYGFKDLRDRPDLVALIPEASKSDGLADILRAANCPGSEIMTLGCDCVSINGNCVASYISIAFRDSERNTADALARLAEEFIQEVQITESHKIRMGLSIEPLRNFFGAKDCFELLLKIFGHGPTPRKAWSAFEHGAAASSLALQACASNGNKKASANPMPMALPV